MALDYIKRIVSFDFTLGSFKEHVSFIIIIILPYLILLEWNNRNKKCPLFDRFSKIKVVMTILFILLFGQFDIQSKFIYFQF